MKKMKPPTRMAYRMLPKSLAAHRTTPSLSLESYVVQMHGQPTDEEPMPYLEPDFDLDPEEEDTPAPSSQAPDRDAMAAVVRASFNAAVSRQIRRQIDHAKALCIVVIVPTPAWVAPISEHFRATFGSRWHAYERIGSSRIAGLQTPEDSDTVAFDLSRGQCVVGLAADVRMLPKALVTAADITIRLVAPTREVLRTAIARFCRRSCDELPDAAAAGLDLHEIMAAFRPGTGPQRIAQRLAAAATVVRGVVREERLPDLAEAVEYGEAQRFGLSLARDVADYRAGRIVWADLPHGIVLHSSEPGLGKTLYSKLLARACAMPLVLTSAADWFAAGERGYLDQVIRQMRAAFERAAGLGQPAILFLDEIDSIPDRATLDPHNRDFWTPIVNELLLRVADARELIIIGATNNVRALDRALLRPGRLEKVIEIVRPDFAGTLNILKFHARGDIPGLELDEIARLAVGSTGAEIMALVRDGRRIARHAGRALVAGDLRAVLLQTRRQLVGEQLLKLFEAGAPTSPNMLN